MPAPLRSQATRDRILAEARRLFAEHGFERTTIRAIAAAADINPAMVIRYYHSKDELFATAADIDLRLPDIRGVPQERMGEVMVEHFLDRWEGEDAGDELPVMLRAAASHEGARLRFIEMLEAQVAPMIASVCPPPHDAVCRGLVATQLSGLAFTRYVLKLPPVVALDRETIVRRVGAAVQAHLSIPVES